MQEKLEHLLDSTPAMLAITLVGALGLIATVAGGYIMAYKLVTFLGN